MYKWTVSFLGELYSWKGKNILEIEELCLGQVKIALPVLFCHHLSLIWKNSSTNLQEKEGNLGPGFIEYLACLLRPMGRDEFIMLIFAGSWGDIAKTLQAY